MSTASMERVCERDGCEQSFTGRADKRFCSDTCRAMANLTRNQGRKPEARVTDNRLATISVIGAAPGPAWDDPPSAPRRAFRTAEPCPGCGELLAAGCRGTWRACGRCRMLAVPAAVSAPYSRGQEAQQRQVLSQRERDLAALALARRKGVMLAGLDALAADDRLHPESVPVVEWLASEVRAAATGERLNELAELAADPEAGIRRRRWWHGQPAALAAAYDDGQDDDDGPEPARDPAPLAIAASPVIDYAAELAARGWILRQHGAGICAVVKPCSPGCPSLQEPWECGRRAARIIPGGSICGDCHAALTRR